MVIIDNKSYEFRRLHRFEEIARALLHKPKSNFLHFSFITKRRRILSIGWNDTTKDCKLIRYPLGGRHSEASAIMELDNLNDCRRATLVNVRLNNKKELRNSKPCPVCIHLLKIMDFRDVYYSTNDGFDHLSL